MPVCWLGDEEFLVDLNSLQLECLLLARQVVRILVSKFIASFLR